jgi:predicted HD phosphohydrolase
MKTVNFSRMRDGTKQEYAFLDQLEQDYIAGLPERLISALERLENSISGYRISRLQHSLQSATRAHRAGESEELVIAALLHDIGDELAPSSHSELAAAVLRPYVSEKTYWIIKHHGLFQMFYYAHHCGGNRHARDKFKDHQWFTDAVNFCEHYDQNCFDPDYANLPLTFFEPMLRRIFKQPLVNDYEHQARYGD